MGKSRRRQGETLFKRFELLHYTIFDYFGNRCYDFDAEERNKNGVFGFGN